jgi:peptide-methionine (R)-S-oxide reductase
MAMSEFSRRIFIFGGAAAASAAVFLSVNKIGSFALADQAEQSVQEGPATIVEFGDDGRRIGLVKRERVRRTAGEWQKRLSLDSYRVTRHAWTETPESGELTHEHRAGIFRCVCCDNALFDSKAKFESGTGWPSFWEAIAAENLYEKMDASLGMVRREVKCTLCDAHLGHVFADGPDPTGLRYCMNSVALRFCEGKTA